MVNRIILSQNIGINLIFSNWGRNPQALAAMNINEVPYPNWYVDTSATTHMSNDLGNLIIVLLAKVKRNF